MFIFLFSQTRQRGCLKQKKIKMSDADKPTLNETATNDEKEEMTSARTRVVLNFSKKRDRNDDDNDKKEEEEEGAHIGGTFKFRRPDGQPDGEHRFSVEGPISSGEQFAYKLNVLMAVSKSANILAGSVSKLWTVKEKETDGRDPTKKLRQIMQVEALLRGLDHPKYSAAPIVKDSVETLLAGSGDLPDRIKLILKGAIRAQTARSRRAIDEVKREYEGFAPYANDRPEFFSVVHAHLLRGWKHIIDQVEREFAADEANRLLQDRP